MEKTITLSDIYAKFTKNFDTFGKMVGSTMQKTEVSQDGLEPRWKATITLKVPPKTVVVVKAFDQDITENEYMGTAQLNLETLKLSGSHSLTIIGEDGKSIGDIFFKYQIQEPPKPINPEINQTSRQNKTIEKKPEVVKESALQKQYSKSIKITNITAKFTKNFDTFGKMQPFLVFKLGQVEDKTEVFQGKSLDATWTKSITLGYNNEENLQIKGYDEDMTENQYIGTAVASLKKLQKSGNHTVEMIGEDQKSIGSISFQYEGTGLFESQKVKVETTQKPVPVSQKKISIPEPKSKLIVVEEPNPKIIQKAQSKHVEPVPVVEQMPIVEKEPVVTQKKQQLKPVESKALNKSRDSFKLPSIGDTSRNYGDKIYDRQSSATLQKSILVYSMPKASRFNVGPKYVGEPSYYVDSCFKLNSTKGVGFGFGSKRQFPEWMQKNMKENPAPGAYFEQSKLTSIRSKGPTFGISYKYYEKVTIPTEKSPERVSRSNQRLKPIISSK